MIVSSLIDNKKYLWIRIPKTATRSYQTLFFGKIQDARHLSYEQCIKVYEPHDDIFSVIRHPRQRLRSGIRSIILHSRSQRAFDIPTNNITELCEYFFDRFDKNFVIKNQYQELYTGKFLKDLQQSQTQFLTNANAKIFKYENLQEFNNWVKLTLGYDTENLKTIGKIKLASDQLLDFNDPLFDKLARYLYPDDYTTFGYN